MSPVEIAKAWKDCAYRDSLSEEQRAALPANPAGASATNYSYGEVQMFSAPTHEILTLGCCDGFTQGPGLCSWFCGSGELSDQTYGCCTPGR